MSMHQSAARLHGGMAVSRRWEDWVSVLAGLYLALAVLWTTGAPAVWFVPLGVLVIVAGLWSEAQDTSLIAEVAVGILGIITFISPWLGSFTGMMRVDWTAWIVGAVTVVMAIIALFVRRGATSGRHTT